jgi:hypothetical protein
VPSAGLTPMTVSEVAGTPQVGSAGEHEAPSSPSSSVWHPVAAPIVSVTSVNNQNRERDMGRSHLEAAFRAALQKPGRRAGLVSN